MNLVSETDGYTEKTGNYNTVGCVGELYLTKPEQISLLHYTDLPIRTDHIVLFYRFM